MKICPGFHYQWECGKQASYGPSWVDEIGSLVLKNGGKKLTGTGLRFFYAQCLMGDSVDNIPGLGRFGPKKTHTALFRCKTEEELFNTVLGLYVEKLGEDEGRRRLLEMGRLLWMTREMNDGAPVLWEFPKI